MATFRVGVDVEVQQDPNDPGLRGCWFTATITHVARGNYTVEYHEIITDDGARDTDVVPLSRLRPIYPDDSRSVPLERRSCGEPVDCWYDDGWWEGYVHVTTDTKIVVTFPEGTADEVEVPLDQSDVEKESDRTRLRTRRKWLYRERVWTPVTWKTWPGARNERTTGHADASRNTAGRVASADRTDGQANERAAHTAPVAESGRSRAAADRTDRQADERAARTAPVAESGRSGAAAAHRTDGQANERAGGAEPVAENGRSRVAAPDRAVHQTGTPQVAAGAGAAADLPGTTASQAAPLERAASRAEVLQRAASAAALPKTAPSHAAAPLPKLASKLSKDIFEQKQRELDQQRARKKASKLPAFDSASDDSDDDATPKEKIKKGAAQKSEREADESAGQKHKAAADKSDLKLKLPASKLSGQKLNKAGESEVKAATWTKDRDVPSSSAAGQAASDADPLGKATVLGGAASELAQKKDAEALKGARAAPQQKQVRTQKDASKGASAAPQQNQAKGQKDAEETAKGKAATKGTAIVPPGTKKKAGAAKKEPAGAKSRTGAVPTPEEEEAVKLISQEGWKPITNVDKDKPWTAEEIDMMYMIEGKVEDMLVRRYVILKLLPCRDTASHREARRAHKLKLLDIRAAAGFGDAAAAVPGGQTVTNQRPVQRQQSVQQVNSQQQRQLHIKTAAPSSRPGPGAIAAADSPREQGGAVVKGTGAKGDDASLPNSPTAAADTPTAAQACRGKPKVTEIFGKSSLLAPTLAELQQDRSRLSSQGLGGMPDWDAPATSAAAAPARGKVKSDSANPRADAAAQPDAAAAAAQTAAPEAAPEPLKAEQAPQQWVPTDPRLRFNQRNRAAEATSESIVPKAENAQTKQEPSHPEPSHGDVQMSDDCAEPLPESEPEVKVDTSKLRKRSRSPEDRDHAPEVLPDFPHIKLPRTRLGAKADSVSPSHIICLDGIGAVFKSNKELEAALRPFVPDFTKVEIAHEVVEGMSCLGGWAAVFFPSAQDAAEYLSTMQNLYLKTSASPLPRPLLAHYPRKSSEEFRKHVNHGFPKGIFVAPHFAQPNSIEFEPALRWRQLQRSLADAKRLQREARATDLAEVMRAYQKEVGAEEASADQAPPPPPLKSSWLFVKGIGGPALENMGVIRSAFDQWGAREIRVLKDPATHQLRGIALIRLNDPYQVELLKGDLDEMVYIMAGSPRPVEAYMLDTGLPRDCWQAVYDSALFQVFKRDDRGNGPVEPPGAPPPRLLKIEENRARSLEEWYSLRLRVLAERSAEERVQLQELVNGQRDALHGKHTRQIDQEMAKLIDANMMNCKPIMRQQCTVKRPIKPLRDLPERYRYLLQNGAVKVTRPPNNPAAVRPASGNGVAAGNMQNPAQRAPVAPPGAARQGRPNPAGAVRHMPVGRGMTMGATGDRAKAVSRRQNARQARPGRGHRRGAQ
ncbi:hypothetical protein COCOBI_09-1600 [Coccomyxa sp. Obi]|nr:hypothetical protein COCOBI_09-1600 [Coccomyxa sp. Obi]